MRRGRYIYATALLAVMAICMVVPARSAKADNCDGNREAAKECVPWARHFDPSFDVYITVQQDGRCHNRVFWEVEGRRPVDEFYRCMTEHGYPTHPE